MNTVIREMAERKVLANHQAEVNREADRLANQMLPTEDRVFSLVYEVAKGMPGKKIQQIKIIRNAFGFDLRDAKMFADVMDALVSNHPGDRHYLQEAGDYGRLKVRLQAWAKANPHYVRFQAE